jgi:hypothetical protein
VHHVAKPCNNFQSVPPKVSIDDWVGDAIVEAAVVGYQEKIQARKPTPFKNHHRQGGIVV